MLRLIRFGARALGLILFAALPAHAQWEPDICGCREISCPPEAEVVLEFARTFTGTYRNGEPHDVWTVDPSGRGETLEEAGITLRVRLTCVNGPEVRPVVGLAAEEILLFSSSICHCRYLTAAHPTDENGWTEFTGAMPGGGCADRLTLFADGIGIVIIPIRINSLDAVPASACAIDASDLSALAERLGDPARYTICSDTNEDGSIDSSELSALANALGARCP